jgi:hypothetical protein
MYAGTVLSSNQLLGQSNQIFLHFSQHASFFIVELEVPYFDASQSKVNDRASKTCSNPSSFWFESLRAYPISFVKGSSAIEAFILFRL